MKAMLTNKDADTAAAAAGAVAGAYYGISEDLRKKVLSYLPSDFIDVIEKFDEDDSVNDSKTVV
jgi:ADP-ribosylglycohydrolase